MDDPLIRAIFMAQFAATWFMTGLIWFVQVVHYPLLAHTGRERYVDYQRLHMSLTTWVVGPPMLVEAITALLMFRYRPTSVTTLELSIGLALVAAIWLSTLLFQVRCHRDLCAGFEATCHGRLVATNWIRTAAWSLRGALTLWMAWDGLSA